jgi:hypothetical protein
LKDEQQRREAMRLVLFVLFWVGVFTAVREWVYARKHGLAITLAEKIYLAMALPLIFGAQLVLDLMGITPEVATASSAIAMGVALNAWVIKRRIRRTSSRGVSKA